MGYNFEDAVQVVSICSLVLVFKFVFTSVLLGGKRQRAPEDGFNTDLKEGLTDSKGFDASQRYKRIVMNDLENIPFGLILMWTQVITGAYAFTGESKDAYWQSVSGLAIIFVIGRVGHTICYIYSLMPWRSIVWLIALLASFGMGITTVYASFKIKSD